MAPKGTPAAIVNRLNTELGRITSNAEVRRAWATQGSTAMTMGVDEFNRYLVDDIAKWARIVKISGVRAESPAMQRVVNGIPCTLASAPTARLLDVLPMPSEAPSLGAGEASIGPAAATIANALFDALGVRLRELPLTRRNIIAAMDRT